MSSQKLRPHREHPTGALLARAVLALGLVTVMTVAVPTGSAFAQDGSWDSPQPIPSGQPMPSHDPLPSPQPSSPQPSPAPDPTQPSPPGGPAGAPQPPVVAPQPCHCEKVSAVLKPVNAHAYGDTYETFWFSIHWSIDCSKGQLPRCKGEIRVNSSDLSINGVGAKDQPVEVSCAGPCGTTRTGERGFRIYVSRVQLKAYLAKGAPQEFRKHLRVRTRCENGTWSSYTATLVFRKGIFDRRRSDLDGDGRADG